MGFETPEVKPEFEETINGIRIICNIGSGDTWYSLYLPQISNKPTVSLSEDPKVAQEVFDYAKELAEEGNDAETIYTKCEKYFKGLTETKTYYDGTPSPSL
jgi:hypothetical protein